MIPMLPRIKMVLTIKISIKQIMQETQQACFCFLACSIIKINLALGSFTNFTSDTKKI